MALREEWAWWTTLPCVLVSAAALLMSWAAFSAYDWLGRRLRRSRPQALEQVVQDIEPIETPFAARMRRGK